MSARRTSSELDDVRAVVAELAAAQGGVFRRSDLIAWGLEPTLVVTMKRNGIWRRLHHGVYVDVDVWTASTDPATRHALIAAATIAALPSGVALYGPSAAVIHGHAVDRGLLGQVHIVRPKGADSRALTRRLTAIDRLTPAIVHTFDVPEGLLTLHSGLPVAGPDLAACSTAMVSSHVWAIATLDSAAWQDPDSIRRFTEISDLWPRISGAGRLRAALPHVRSGAQTPLESISRVKLIANEVPEPMLQVPLVDETGQIGIVDMLFEGLSVVGEADGALKYDGPDGPTVLRLEKRREDRIRRQGFGVVRWGWGEAMGSMRGVARDIWAASRVSRRRVG